MEQVRIRVAPSPTGNLHLGTAYATLWPFVFARKNNGIFILRIEDTDKDRSTKEYEQNILDGLIWLGFHWDEGPYHQMDRLGLYKKYSDKLLAEDKAFLCFCTKEELDADRTLQQDKRLPQIYSGKCRSLTKSEIEAKKSQNLPFAVRFKLPNDKEKIEYEDLIHGKISFDPKQIGDVVIMRQNEIPLYNFAVVVDDIEMEISHVLRGDDHISNTPKQILLFEAFGKIHPIYGHYPVILNQDRSGKLSKRTGSTAVLDYKHEGYLEEAFINYLALLGWTPPNGKEILSIDEIIKLFDIKDINKAPAAWNQEKLDWLNGEYIRKISDEELTKRLQEYLVDHPAREKISPLTPLIKERIKKLSDFIPLTDFIFNEPEYDIKIFQKLNSPSGALSQNLALEKVLESLEKMDKPWKAQEFEETFRKLADDLKIGAGEMFQLIRVAISGQLVTPPLFESIQILGEEKTIERVKKAMSFWRMR